MMDILAALGLHQIKKLDSFIAKRQEYAGIYNSEFNDIEEITIPYVKPKVFHARHLYPIHLNLAGLNGDRGQFIEKMKERNIGTTVNFIPIHLHPYYQKQWGLKAGDYPVSESVYEGLASIPLYPKMGQSDVEDVIEAVKQVITEMKR